RTAHFANLPRLFSGIRAGLCLSGRFGAGDRHAAPGNTKKGGCGGECRNRGSADRGVSLRDSRRVALIGRTPLVMFRKDRMPMGLIAIGDEVRFRAITREEFAAWPRP